MRECARTHTHYCWCRGCCYWSLCVCAPSEQHTYTNTLRHTTHNLRRPPLPLIADRVSFVFHFPINQPDSFHTSYHWAPFSFTVFRSRQSISPLIGGHSHVRTHTPTAKPRYPATSFQGSAASQLFLATTMMTVARSFSLLSLCFSTMLLLLTLDHSMGENR